MVNICCQLDKNHHGDEPIDVTVRDFLYWVNRGGEFPYVYGMGQDLKLNFKKKEKRAENEHPFLSAS